MRLRLLSLYISIGNYESFVDRLIKSAQHQMSGYVCIANVHMLVEAYNDPSFATVVNNADMVTPDGMPLAKAMKLLFGINQDRVAGMDLLPDLLNESAQKSISVYFYGGTQIMLDKTEAYCKAHFPSLNIAGLYSPPFRPLNSQEEIAIINTINNSGAKFVFVALGCPKQEKWMAAMKGRINACMIGIGGALPVMVGMQKRAPLWMQRLSLEWLYRLIQEPQRLFKRYAVTNTTFLYLLFKQWGRQGFRTINNNA